ncbi:hypothetical protein Poli38472_008246 [Pythium oligandrum]|uniref:Fatty acyl-CoA reductase C-terminal domain-containing protein n=1 Tax=Pythium oligandrum TaxID=41045 RepID=A0A8K1CLA0_PYTOL|nr:hypothetical protein Poli38472_008246 [Pythium oligandrum]|eukprot:TMW65604.1 hypothetical protein Poli38472_008246 [Pythium oligandrum]
MIRSKTQFKMEWFFSYVMPTALYSGFANTIPGKHHKKQAAQLKKLTRRAETLYKVFKPFGKRQWVFTTDSMDILAKAVESTNAPDSWLISTKSIDWERYITSYCFGLKKYMLHEDVSKED